MNAMVWQPIDTAPKDGTPILVYEYGEIHITEYCTFWPAPGVQVTGWVSPDAGELGPWTMEPTHWMPLPEGPK